MHHGRSTYQRTKNVWQMAITVLALQLQSKSTKRRYLLAKMNIIMVSIHRIGGGEGRKKQRTPTENKKTALLVWSIIFFTAGGDKLAVSRLSKCHGLNWTQILCCARLFFLHYGKQYARSCFFSA